MSRALTDQESAVFERILNGDGIGLVQTAFDGEDTAVIAEFVMDDEGDMVEVHPLAVLLTDALFDRLTPPEGATEVNGPDDGGFFDDEDEHPADCDGSVEAPYEGFGGQPVTGTCQHPSHGQEHFSIAALIEGLRRPTCAATATIAGRERHCALEAGHDGTHVDGISTWVMPS